jgi:hypothetical protein
MIKTCQGCDCEAPCPSPEKLDYIGNCVDSFDENGNSIFDLPFSDVTEFAQMVEENDNVTVGNFVIKYNEDEDIHYFYKKC